MVRREMQQAAGLLISGRNAVDEGVRHGLCRQHINWWMRIVDVVAKRSLQRSQELILTHQT